MITSTEKIHNQVKKEYIFYVYTNKILNSISLQFILNKDW